MAETLNQRWAATIVAELAGAGVSHAVVAPGSRSTPLTLAFADSAAFTCWSILDERSAAFFALGLAKALGQPVAVVCTSGTAGAHFLPAAIEAAEGRTPLVAITTDRPWELHGFGAQQSIDQDHLFGRYSRAFAALTLPEDSPAVFGHLRAVIGRTVAAARGSLPGPVQINVPFREPLAPPPGGGRVVAEPSGVTFAKTSLAPSAEALTKVGQFIGASRRGVIVAGPREIDDELPQAISALAKHLGYPVLAEAASNMRFGFADSIGAYDVLLRHQPFVEANQPDLILRFGSGITTRTLQEWMDQSPATIVSFTDDGTMFDPQHRASLVVTGDPAAACWALMMQTAEATDQSFRTSFINAQRAALAGLGAMSDVLDEPSAARALARALPEGSAFFLGNSMPIRDVDTFAIDEREALRVYSNRGVNGIDGVVSTALGVAAGSGLPTCLVIGDLSLLHDVSGLLAAKRLGIPLTIVAFNNDGGGIFHFLPAVGESEHFEHYFATPHHVELRQLAALAGAAYQQPTTVAEFEAAVLEASQGGLHLIEVVSNRDGNVEAHRRRFGQVAEALGSGPWR